MCGRSRRTPSPGFRWAAAVGRVRVLGAAADPATVEELLSWASAPHDEAGSGPVEGDGQEFGNVAMLVGEYGLPRSREAMLTYLRDVP
ncbi:hypothetical protein [Micromonospora sp. NPDC048898]|uniref:hypothetical protein n=1 Tax=Micromonospora sp. NPDC048898 TaxID=3364260 RepID=UPI003713B143